MAVKKDTKTKILDAAEELFSKNGIGTTSLRTIIAKANVNIAAIHYHFGSKGEVVTAVYARRVGPINKLRLEKLKDLNEKAEQNSPAIEEIIDAFLSPILDCSQKSKKDRERLMGLFSKIHTESAETSHIIHLFKDVFEQFMLAASKALPKLSSEDLIWRFMFMLGIMSVSISDNHLLKIKLKEFGAELNYQELLNQAVAFVAAGFQGKSFE